VRSLFEKKYGHIHVYTVSAVERKEKILRRDKSCESKQKYKHVEKR